MREPTISLFALTVSDVLIIHIDTHDVENHEILNLKNLFEDNFKLFN